MRTITKMETARIVTITIATTAEDQDGDETAIQSANAIASANATVAVNTLNGTYVCSLEGIASSNSTSI